MRKIMIIFTIFVGLSLVFSEIAFSGALTKNEKGEYTEWMARRKKRSEAREMAGQGGEAVTPVAAGAF